jgi:hypothetical protein
LSKSTLKIPISKKVINTPENRYNLFIYNALRLLLAIFYQSPFPVLFRGVGMHQKTTKNQPEKKKKKPEEKQRKKPKKQSKPNRKYRTEAKP